MNVAIIPARGGSKRIPRKNMRLFRGKPVIAWSVTAALESGLFDEVMVSTDDAEIAGIARDWGAAVPFMRSAENSDDHATTAAVLKEVFAAYRVGGRIWDHACCLYPTAPFATAQDLEDGYSQLLGGDFDVIMPVAAFSYPIWRSLRRGADGRLEMNFPENVNARSQDLPKAFHDAGQWYWFRVEAFARDGTLLGPNTGSIPLREICVQDIDTEEDWMLAELKHRAVFG